MKKSFFRLIAVFVLCILLSNPALSCEGAKKGIQLWSLVVLPNLLPFMICSNIIVSLDAVPLLIFPFRWILQHILYLSPAGCYTFITGLLCGYPMGAKTCSEFMDSHRISKKEGQYLLSICNHPSPMFLLGYTGALLSPDIPVWKFLCSVYLPVIPLAWFARKYYGITHISKDSVQIKKHSASFDESIMASCETMVKIGGYIMLFSIFSLFILNLPLGNIQIKAVALSLIEITTGVQAITSYMPSHTAAVCMAGAVSLGGLSGIFQTKSVMKNAGLSIRHYVLWKIVHTLFSILLFVLLLLMPLPLLK